MSIEIDIKLFIEATKYVEWFHKKFRMNYHPQQFSTMKQDHTALAYIIKRFNVKTALEIGTWKGDTALMMYLMPEIERVKCIDIHKDMGIDFKHGTNSLLDKEEYGMMFKNSFVELQFADTMTYARGCEQHDLVFVDGCHDYEHIKNDTELALSMKPKVVAWHDYGNGHADIDKFLGEFAQTHQLVTFAPTCGSCITACAL